MHLNLDFRKPKEVIFEERWKESFVDENGKEVEHVCTQVIKHQTTRIDELEAINSVLQCMLQRGVRKFLSVGDTMRIVFPTKRVITYYRPTPLELKKHTYQIA